MAIYFMITNYNTHIILALISNFLLLILNLVDKIILFSAIYCTFLIFANENLESSLFSILQHDYLYKCLKYS